MFQAGSPPQDQEKGFGSPQESKLIKYEHPPKVPTELFCLKVSLFIWEKVSGLFLQR
ncbi:hypothetical protein VL20_327 [Microcystis panniformis FACHB-1757]|uniref:Uncharacterized protein n=2 Tax=Microcystis TaxID=1125 RepID=A0A0A1VSN6_MICAE|nr:hypothetical protein VL20_327 [Microcystis panniformis FACHB-1757]GAL92760.1 hypothetical protein N44_01318 [Microcystis aeruginosa NIES-44]